jgi:hypothetical protein
MPALQKCFSRPYVGSEANQYNCTVSAWNECPQDKETVEQDWVPVRNTTGHDTALKCTALHCIPLYCTALHGAALHYTALHCTTRRRTPLHGTALHGALHFSAK